MGLFENITDLLPGSVLLLWVFFGLFFCFFLFGFLHVISTPATKLPERLKVVLGDKCQIFVHVGFFLPSPCARGHADVLERNS